MNPKHGTLTGEPIAFNDVSSLNSLFRGEVQLADGSVKPCLLKSLGRIELVNELVSNYLANKLGLPVPMAVLTFVPDQFNAKNQFSKAPSITGGCLVFSSIDVGSPNLAQQLKNNHPLGRQIISHTLNNWEKKGNLYGFDTWLANVDRHLGNVLFGVKNELWLIDHGRSFTKEDWIPSDLVPDVTYPNRLQEWYTQLMTPANRKQTVVDLTESEKEFATVDLSSVLTDSLTDGLTAPAEQKALLSFLSERIKRVAMDGAVALNP